MCVTYSRVWSVTGPLWVLQIDTEIVRLLNQIKLSIIEIESSIIDCVYLIRAQHDNATSIDCMYMISYAVVEC